MFKYLFLLFVSINFSFAEDLGSITNLLKKTHQDCGKFVLLSDRLLCYRRVKKEHREALNSYFKKIESEGSFPKENIIKLKKEIYSQLEIVY